MGEFPESVVREALTRVGGRCECRRTNKDCAKRHDYVRCPKDNFIMNNRGTKWEAHHKTSREKGRQPVLSNCEILCVDCHEATRTYGG